MSKHTNRVASMARNAVGDALGGLEGIDHISRLVHFWAEAGDTKVDPELIEAFSGLLGQIEAMQIVREHRVSRLRRDVLEGRRARRERQPSKRITRKAEARPRIAPGGE
jgi:hypothetical protein